MGLLGVHSFINLRHLPYSEPDSWCPHAATLSAVSISFSCPIRVLGFHRPQVSLKPQGLPSSKGLLLAGFSDGEIRADRIRAPGIRAHGIRVLRVEGILGRSVARRGLNLTGDLKGKKGLKLLGRGVKGAVGQLRRALYDEFVRFSVEKVGQHENLSPVTLKDDYDTMVALDGKTIIRNIMLNSEKIRSFRIATIDGGDTMQVLNVAIFADWKYDLPIFCADFFSTSKANIFVL